MNQDAPGNDAGQIAATDGDKSHLIRVDLDTEPARLRRSASVSQTLYGRSTADQRKYESEDNADDRANPREIYRGAGDAAETQDGSDQRDD